MNNMPIKIRLKKLLKIISKDIFEKEKAFKLALLAMLSGESIFLFGKPGTAKSMLARRMKEIIKDGVSFEYLMSKFSTPEDIFGPISIKKLQEGSYVRIIDNYLPTANIAFLDEIWKASPSILNNLLTIINERIFKNGDRNIKVPLWLFISASNEFPEKNKGLEALYDRFIIRYISKPLTLRKNFENMLLNPANDIEFVPDYLKITTKEYNDWKIAIKNIKILKDTVDFINILRKEINNLVKFELYVSDRRWSKIIHLMQTSAFSEGRDFITKEDWFVIPYCIWSDEYNKEEAKTIFNNVFKQNYLLDFKIKEKFIQDKIKELEYSKENVSNEKYLKVLKGNEISKAILSGHFYEIKSKYFNYLDKCYISVFDFNELVKLKANKSQCFIVDKNNKIQKILLKLRYIKSNTAQIDVSVWKKYNAYFPLSDDKSKENELKQINLNLKKLKADFKKLKEDKKNELKRLKTIDTIYFDDDIRSLALEIGK